jgi:ABC-2 type transport system ATP-binding protein
MSECAVCTNGLTKHYGKTEALNDLDLDIQMGEVFRFLGPNGAGKTTIRTLVDEIRATRGDEGQSQEASA